MMKMYPDVLTDLILQFLKIILVILAIDACDKIAVV